MRLLLVNPCNSAVSFIKANASQWTRYRVWKPLGLMVVAALTPRDWEITIIDENLGVPDYSAMARPDLVGITAFTSQVTRAYAIAAEFRGRGIPVVMGGIHVSMCPEEALQWVTSVVKGEAESVWSRVIEDATSGQLQRVYEGTRLSLAEMPAARHDLLPQGYHFGSIQTSRGCPLNCSFCSVTAFNGGMFRRRPVEHIIEELKSIHEKYVLIVDDNFIGIRVEHIAQTKDLLREIIKADLGKKWITQVTINIADDEELLRLAAQAGCCGVFIGFETITDDGLAEISKKGNLRQARARRSFRESVRTIQKHGLVVVGSFIMGLDVDRPGIGERVADAALHYGVDILNAMYLTPLPGTRLWEKMKADDRIAANDFPADWVYYTLTFPVAKYNHLSWRDMVRENNACNRKFYSVLQIARRVVKGLVSGRHPFILLVANLSYRMTAVSHFYEKFTGMDFSRGRPVVEDGVPAATEGRSA
jgi:radical SAM superfamily enzyme YgiQ (UPF0313 family)